ncbi:hypothetical protein [Sulfuriflexus mobilis]|uniref:hypothetical protein n=1 Tax=Sulfuriflexus mobilis TaxID=1811807 RepID=UPI000F827739|nr:hypothetical protein [Sulfuriflexus mobilis]
MKLVFIFLIITMGLSACSKTEEPGNDSVGIAPISEEDVEARATDRSKVCTATVASASENDLPGVHFSCSDSDCQSSNPVGKKLDYACRGNVCPVSTSSTDALASCVSGGQGYSRACRVTLSHVTSCHNRDE